MKSKKGGNGGMLILDQKYYILSTDSIELEKMSRLIYQFLQGQPDHRSITVEIKVEEL